MWANFGVAILTGITSSGVLVAVLQAFFPKRASKIERSDAAVRQALDVSAAAAQLLKQVMERDGELVGEVESLRNDVSVLKKTVERMGRDFRLVYLEWKRLLPGEPFPVDPSNYEQFGLR